MRVLVVDDDPDIRRLLRLSLERMGGLVVDACASGQEAIERARSAPPDVLLLDSAMPGMNGAQLLDAWRREPGLVDVPVVFLTAEAETAAAALSPGVAGVISKPFEARTLAAKLVRLLEETGTGPRD